MKICLKNLTLNPFASPGGHLRKQLKTSQTPLLDPRKWILDLHLKWQHMLEAT